jgi:6-pyruvoyl-tetrahydropterin synthase
MTKETFPNTVQVIIDMLKRMDVDGETMQHILKETGMDYQMLKQLMLTSNINHVKDFYREALDQEDDRYLNEWDEDRGLESETEEEVF